jgi:uncharacterized protein YndB with AHSA1/START domain
VLKKILLSIVGLLVILVGVAYLLPRNVKVERSATISAPADRVFALVSDFGAFNKWSPWFGIDPNTKYEITGQPGTVGHSMKWSSDHKDVGSGTQSIVEVRAGELVRTSLDFGDMGTALAEFRLSGKGDTTEVTWTLESDMGNNPIGRWMGLMMDKWIGADYEKGLAALAGVARQQ